MKLNSLLVASCACALSQTSFADVKSLTSSELTETYIKDSTIIVTPAKKDDQDKPRQVVTYTIGPGEPVKSEAEEQAETLQERSVKRSTTDIAEESARQIVQEVAFIERQTPQLAPLTEREINIPQVPGFQIPEGAFDMPLVGNDLGISSDGQQLTFSIGNLPGMDPANYQAIESDTVNLVPRPGGGFDMTIQIPPPQ